MVPAKAFRVLAVEDEPLLAFDLVRSRSKKRVVIGSFASISCARALIQKSSLGVLLDALLGSPPNFDFTDYCGDRGISFPIHRCLRSVIDPDAPSWPTDFAKAMHSGSTSFSADGIGQA